MSKLWHDDVRPAPEGWLWARTNQQARYHLLMAPRDDPIEEISLDHDLGHHDVVLPDDPDELAEVLLLRGRSEDTGLDLVRWMIDFELVPKVVTIHSWNPPGAKAMASALRQAGYPCRVAPFVMPAPAPPDHRPEP